MVVISLNSQGQKTGNFIFSVLFYFLQQVCLSFIMKKIINCKINSVSLSMPYQTAQTVNIPYMVSSSALYEQLEKSFKDKMTFRGTYLFWSTQLYLVGFNLNLPNASHTPLLGMCRKKSTFYCSPN